MTTLATELLKYKIQREAQISILETIKYTKASIHRKLPTSRAFETAKNTRRYTISLLRAKA